MLFHEKNTFYTYSKSTNYFLSHVSPTHIPFFSCDFRILTIKSVPVQETEMTVLVSSPLLSAQQVPAMVDSVLVLKKIEMHKIRSLLSSAPQYSKAHI